MPRVKVLPKAFAVLEYVYGQAAPVLPAEAARAVGLPQATAMRILLDLAEIGYLAQDGARKGYRRGPMAFALSASSEEDEFIHFAAYHIDAAARRFKAALVLSRRHRNWRCVLCHRNYNPGFVVEADRLRIPNLYRTTGGRLLLAHAPPADVDEVVALDGPPTADDWPEAAGSRERLNARLAAIREAGFVERHPSCNGQSHAYALPLFRDGALFGAVAMYWDVTADDAQSADYRAAARVLVDTLSAPRRVIPA